MGSAGTIELPADKPEIALITAMDRSRVIGAAGKLPWRLSDDLRRFKRLTMGHTILVGRKTFESMGALPGRRLVVLSRRGSQPQSSQPQRGAQTPSGQTPNRQARPQSSAAEPGVLWTGSLAAALDACRKEEKVFCGGGAEIYSLCLPLARWLHVTRVEAEVEGDTWFPEVDCDQWRLVSKDLVPADERNEYASRYCVYERISGRPRVSSGDELRQPGHGRETDGDRV